MTRGRVVASLLATLTLVVALPGDASARRKKKEAPSEAELVTAVGTKGDFAPKIFQSLKKGMSPGEVKDIFDRMGAVSTYGYAKAKIKGHKGVWYLRFHFDTSDASDKRDKLKSATVVYQQGLIKLPEFFQRMMTLAQAKWGPAKDTAQVARKIITWVDDGKTRVIQFGRFGEQYELSYEP